jgi:sulfite reductase (NADPH) hemoprotein beta-component
LKEHKMTNDRKSGLRRNSMACTALPTCGLAFAESERYLPTLVSKLENELEKFGLREEEITIRMTGCANGCARPFASEIGLVGRAPGIYNLHIGGGFNGERLNTLYKDGVNEQQIIEALSPLFEEYSLKRIEGERFGDYCIRSGVVGVTSH